MSKFTAKSFDMCAVASQDGSSLAQSAIGAAGAATSATATHDGTNVIYVTGFQITSTNPAATVNGQATLAGLVGGTATYIVVESNTFGAALIVEFPNPIPAVDKNTDVVLTVPAIASGGVVSATLQYYRRPE